MCVCVSSCMDGTKWLEGKMVFLLHIICVYGDNNDKTENKMYEQNFPNRLFICWLCDAVGGWSGMMQRPGKTG